MNKKDNLEQVPKEFHELLMRLKRAAINPSNPELLSKTRRQILSARRALGQINPNFSWNEREYRQFLPQKRTAACDLPPKKQKKQKSIKAKQVQKSIASSAPDVIIHADTLGSSIQIPSPTCSSYSRCPYGWTTAGPVSRTQKETVRQVRTYAAVYNKKREFDESNRLSHFIGDQLQVNVIPIGNHFQADIPEWTGVCSDGYKLDTSKWLGVKIWPIEDTSLGIGKIPIGKGRQDSLCSCIHRDSADCIRLHISEERTRLQFEIGDAYYSWGFDGMGEFVCEEWTLNEQNDFNNLFKRKTTKSKNSFWESVSQVFPLDPPKSIVSYYFNVFVLRNIRRQVWKHSHVVDSDDDGDDDDEEELESKAQKDTKDVPSHDSEWDSLVVVDSNHRDLPDDILDQEDMPNVCSIPILDDRVKYATPQGDVVMPASVETGCRHEIPPTTGVRDYLKRLENSEMMPYLMKIVDFVDSQLEPVEALKAEKVQLAWEVEDLRNQLETVTKERDCCRSEIKTLESSIVEERFNADRTVKAFEYDLRKLKEELEEQTELATHYKENFDKNEKLLQKFMTRRQS